jgi:lipopolysaccharide export system protein LptA
MVNEIDGITVVSKRARYDRNTKSVEFVDSVRVTQSGTVVNAESGFFSTETNTGTFRGSVSLVRTKTEEEAFDMELTCEELDLDASADSFIAKKDAVLRYVDEDGEETVLWADLMDYDGERRILKLTNVVKASSPSLPEGSQVAARTMEFNTETGNMHFTGLDLVLPQSEEAEAES